MNKCLRIRMIARFPDNFLNAFIQKEAKKCGLEGTAQIVNPQKGEIKITICGTAEALDDFIDSIYTGTEGFEIDELEIEPFLKDKDYRQVFRVIE
jgi:acylphosphatase